MFEQDDDEKFRQMLGGIIGQGPAPYDVQTSMEQPDAPPEQSQLSAPYMPQGAAPGGLGGYTPPPAAAPAPLDHVQGHQFGGGDVAMLGGILAALLGGGKHRGEIAGSLAGQYGGAVMQNNARADDRNQKIDQYNNTLENKANDPLERWKADQTAKYQVGSLKTRGDELDLQKTREQRIADAQTAESMKDPAAEAKLVAEARAGVDLDTTRKKNDMEVGTREMLGQILGKQKGEYAAPVKGKNGEPIPLTPEKELKRKLAENAIAGMGDGTVDPLTGKPIEKPKTPAQRAAFADTEIENPEIFAEKNGTASNYQKNSEADLEISKGIAAMKRMRDIVAENGSQWGASEDSARLKGEFSNAKGVVQSAQAKLRALGVLQEKEQTRVDDAIGAEITPGISDITSRLNLGDLRVGRLDGGIKQFQDMQAMTRHANGVRAKGKPAPAEEKDLGASDSGIKFSVDPKAEAKFNAGGFGPSNGDSPTGKPTDGGMKLVQLISPKGARGSRELSDSDLQNLLASGWKVAQ